MYVVCGLACTNSGVVELNGAPTVEILQRFSTKIHIRIMKTPTDEAPEDQQELWNQKAKKIKSQILVFSYCTYSRTKERIQIQSIHIRMYSIQISTMCTYSVVYYLSNNHPQIVCMSNGLKVTAGLVRTRDARKSDLITQIRKTKNCFTNACAFTNNLHG